MNETPGAAQAVLTALLFSASGALVGIPLGFALALLIL